MSWKPEVMVAGQGEKWHDNALRFETKDEAERSASDLFQRWTLTTGHRATESEDPVNYAYTLDGKLIEKKEGQF